MKRRSKTKFAHGPAWWLVGALGVLVASAAYGQPSDGPPPISGRSDGGDGSTGGASAAAALTLLQAGSTCDACPPDETSIELIFSSAVDGGTLLDKLRIAPGTKLTASSKQPRRRVVLDGPFEPQTRYRIEIGGDLCAADGACLAEPASFSFRTGGGYPLVRMPTRNTVLPPGRKLPVLLSHVEKAKVQLIEVKAGELSRAMALVGTHLPDRDVVGLLPAAMQRRAATITIDADAKDGTFELDPFAQGRGPLVLVVLSAKGARSYAGLYQRGDLGVLVKFGLDGGLVWVTDTANGKPVGGAAVTISHGDRATHHATTNAQGLARLPSKDRLRRKGVKTPLIAHVESAARAAVTAEDFDTALQPWMFDLPYYDYSGSRAIRGMITAERGIYRPGETVHLLGVMRRKQPNGTLTPPGGQAKVQVRSPDGAVVADESVRLTPFGTARLDVKLKEFAEVGRYHVRLEKDGATLTSDFEVGEFRAATFEVKLPDAGAAETADDHILVPVTARYLHGAPLVGGKVAWSASYRHRHVRFAGYEHFRFRGDGWYYYSQARGLTSDEATLDDQGQAMLRLPLSALPKPREDESQSIDVIFEVTVTDAADDAITARTVQRVDRTDTFVGVGSRQWVASPKRGWDVEVVALDPSGRAVAGKQLVLELHRTYWNSIAEKGPHGVRYRTSRQNEVVATREVTTGPQSTAVHLDIVGGGSYELKVRDVDQQFVVNRSVWAYGKDAVGPAFNTPRIELELDKQAYEPGDVAQVFVASPYPKSTALVTVERGTILQAQVIELEGADRPIEVPVSERYLPNAYVGVAVVPRVRGQGGPAAGYPFRAGYRELRVSPERRRLEVKITPAREAMEPGEEAVARVQVRDHHGRPVRAEVTIWAADEGVLMLTGYRTPDPFKPAYARHALEVTNALNLERWTEFDPAYWADGGGDSGAVGTALRSRFFYTAFFSRGVVTNAQGEASVRFRLPDNITRWRLMAVAADRGERFGRAQASVRASKPLHLSPVLPRFVTEGDLVDAGVVVHNDTGAEVRAEVALTVEGAELLGSKAHQVEVPARSQQVVRAPMMVREPGPVTFRATVQAGVKRDGFAIELPAQRASVTQQELVAEGELESKAGAELYLPAAVRPDSAELFVTVSPTVLAALEPGIEALLEYPYGCAEQKTSRLVPMAVLGDLIRDLGLGRLDDRAHRRRLQGTVADLLKHQNDDGGFGLWQQSDSEDFITAYVLFGLQVARDHGYRVPARSIQQAEYYLQHKLQRQQLEPGYFGLDPDVLAAYVLARGSSDEEPTLGAQLFERRSELSHFEQGLLATALGSRDREKGDSVLEELLQLKKQTVANASHAVVPERTTTESSYYNHGEDLRATASAAHALSAAGRPGDAEPLVAGILAQRGSDGTWGTTYNNLWALLALGEYAKAHGRSSSAATVTVKLGERVLGRLTLPSGAQARRLAVPHSALLAPGHRGRLLLESSSADKLRYAIRLRYAVRPSAQQAVKKGYSIERTLLDAKTGDPVSRPRVGQLLRVRLGITADAARHQVAVTDRLPAGFEAVNARLETEQRDVYTENDWRWRSHEIRDDRVSFFAYGLGQGKHTAEYLARASRSGEFVWPAPTVQSMYNPDERGRGDIEHVAVTR